MLKKHLKQKEIRLLNEITDIEKLISRDFKLIGTGNNKYCYCPFHEEKTPSFCVVTHKNFYYCFGCGKSGSAFDYLKERYKNSHYESTRKALTELLTFNGMSVKKLRKLAKEKYPDEMPYKTYTDEKAKGKYRKEKIKAKINEKINSKELRKWARKYLKENPEFLKSEPKETLKYIYSDDIPYIYSNEDEFSDDIPF